MFGVNLRPVDVCREPEFGVGVLDRNEGLGIRVLRVAIEGVGEGSRMKCKMRGGIWGFGVRVQS